jgi:hypothetical protein
MPDMPLSPTTNAVLADLQQRVLRLENFPQTLGPAANPGGTLTLLGQASGVGLAGLSYYNTGGGAFEWMSGALVPQISFTLDAAAWIIVYGSLVCSSTGGTAGNTDVRLAVMSSSTATHGANDVNSVEMQCTRGTAPTNGLYVNVSSFKAFNANAGTYYVGWGYAMWSGATTTFAVNQNEVGAFLMG